MRVVCVVAQVVVCYLLESEQYWRLVFEPGLLDGSLHVHWFVILVTFGVLGNFTFI